MNRLADAENPLVQQTAARLSQGCRSSREQVERFVSFVRDDIKFGFPPAADWTSASETLQLGIGQCNTKGTLLLMPLPDRDFDVTEVAVPWRVLSEAGHQVVFATEQAGTVPAADPRLTGVIFGQLRAAPEPRRFYAELTTAVEFTSTQAWAALDPAAFEGLLLPGGHAPAMRQYLRSAVLRDQVARFRALGRPVGAICHGVLVLARTRDRATGRSVLADRRTTCLPKYMERLPGDRLAARPLLPDLSRLRRRRGQSGTSRSFR